MFHRKVTFNGWLEYLITWRLFLENIVVLIHINAQLFQYRGNVVHSDEVLGQRNLRFHGP